MFEMKKLALILLIALISISCNETKKETEKPTQSTKEIAAKYESIEVEIEGMTCEIGCARTIQSKLSKMDGVSFAKVDFESKKGTFTFDSNIVSKEDIVTKIDGIAGGDLYSVSKTEVLPTIIEDVK